MTRTGGDARAFALRTGSWHPMGMCLVFTRSCFDVPARYGSARLAWENAEFKHRTSDLSSIPDNVPVFWGLRFGHIAFHLGNGIVRSSDWPRRYNVGTARIGDISRAWGHPFLGWTEDVNGVRVWSPPAAGHSGVDAAGGRRVRLSRLQPRSRNDDVRDLQRALRAQGQKYRDMNPHGVTGYFGSETRAMVRAFQRDQGWSGGDADGVPGPSTCDRLGLHVIH